jgi:hypothetical protein
MIGQSSILLFKNGLSKIGKVGLFGRRPTCFVQGLLSGTSRVGIFQQRGILFYSLLVAAYPISFYYAENASESSLDETLATLVVVLGATALFSLLLRTVVRDNAKVAAMVSFLLALFFAYGLAHNLLFVRTQMSIAGIMVGQQDNLLKIIGGIALLGLVAIFLYRRSLAPLVKAGTLLVLVLVLFNIGRAISGIQGGPGGILDEIHAVNAASLASLNDEPLPDIYYIILDGYGRADQLESGFGVDNSEFVDSLTKMGFYVAPESRSNYPPATELAIAAGLAMRYLEVNDNPNTLIRENPVAQLLQEVGYKFVHVGSGWYLTERNPNADVEYMDNNPLRLLVNEFSMALLRLTVASPLAANFGVNLEWQYLQDHTKHFNDAFRWLTEIPDIKNPTFTFSHIFAPHPPYVFYRDGKIRADGGRPDIEQLGIERIIWVNEAYIEQLTWVNKVVEGVVRDILSRSSIEPIIIVQADHGPHNSLGKHLMSSPNANANAQIIIERSGILNAYYLPERCRSGLYPSISPVNSFRVVLNSCLGADFDLLEDQSYWVGDPRDLGKPPIDFLRLPP